MYVFLNIIYYILSICKHVLLRFHYVKMKDIRTTSPTINFSIIYICFLFELCRFLILYGIMIKKENLEIS